MSTTKTAMATPYRKQYADLDVAEGGNQNPEQTETTDPAQQATQTEVKTATSELSTDDSTYQKRWKDLKSYHDKEITKARQRIRELEEANSTSQLAPPKTEEELAELRDQYPDLFDAILTVSQQQAQSQAQTLQQELDSMRSKLMETEAERAISEIQAAHPDYTSIVASPEFAAWLENQDPTIQSWVAENENNSGPFIRALDLYKMDSGVKTTATKGRSKPKSGKADSASAADAVSVNGGAVNVGDADNKRIWTRSEIAAMTPAVYSQFADELDEAAKEGRIMNQ